MERTRLRWSHGFLEASCAWRPGQRLLAAQLRGASPPTAAEAALILEEACKDPDWGAFVLFTMTTGARRGEVCGLRWSQLDLDAGVAVFRASIGQIVGDRWEKGKKLTSSAGPDSSAMTHPNSVTQRYGRPAYRVGIDTRCIVSGTTRRRS